MKFFIKYKTKIDNKILNDYIFMHLNIPKGIINDKLH